MERRKLTLIIFAMDKKRIEKTLLSFLSSDLMEHKIDLFICYHMEKEWIKKYCHKLFSRYKNIRLKYYSMQYNFYYPRGHFFYGHPRLQYRIGKHVKVKPFRWEENEAIRKVYCRCAGRITTPLYALIPDGFIFAKGFWQYSVRHLEENKKCGIVVGSIETIGKGKSYCPSPAFAETKQYERGKGVYPFLMGTQFAPTVVIARKEKVRKVINKYIPIDSLSNRYVFEQGIALYINFFDCVLESHILGTMETSEEEQKLYKCLQRVTLRAVFLKGFCWNYDVSHGEKYDVSGMKQAYHQALLNFHESLQPIYQHYVGIGDEKTATCYKYFMESVTDNIE